MPDWRFRLEAYATQRKVRLRETRKPARETPAHGGQAARYPEDAAEGLC
jgi:hypothetical protein